VGAERARVPGVASSVALVRCAECQRISIAGMVTAFSKSDGARKAESRTPLGRLDGEAWVPTALYVGPLILTPTRRKQPTRGRMRRG
jgi:hypothetical protein